ncbi:MAG: hypothetical protein K0U86_12470 [Planctomycetes bacterium]|nr:hypothetical protein [Planctomycetota bacterium]MCH9725701.1 hypothetical protein [Planctomycetota bacterium]MCH9777756.1 hypothetical protein [Planctomycetota bacterium]
MTLKCPQCGQTRKVFAFKIVSDVCEECGYLPLQTRITRWVLQALSLFLLLWGMTLLWHAVQLANQDFLHLFHPSTTYGYENRTTLLKSLILSAVVGVFICTMSLIMFDLAMHSLRAKVSKVHAVVKRVSSKMSMVSLSVLCVVVVIVPVWVWFDACFQPALSWARVDLGIPDEVGLSLIELNSMGAAFLLDAGKPTYFQKIHSMSALGPRIWTMIFILCVTSLSLLLGVMHVVFNGDSKKYILVFTVTVIGLAAIVHQRENFLWYSVRHRVANHLPLFQNLQQELKREWPTTSGTLPEVGKYFAHEQRPDELFLLDPTSYGVAESLGGSVIKLPDGGFSFTLGPHYLFLLEYHPQKRVPLAKVQSEFWTSHLVRSSEIEEGWFLTQYTTVRKEKGVDTKTTEN